MVTTVNWPGIHVSDPYALTMVHAFAMAFTLRTTLACALTTQRASFVGLVGAATDAGSREILKTSPL